MGLLGVVNNICTLNLTWKNKEVFKCHQSPSYESTILWSNISQCTRGTAPTFTCVRRCSVRNRLYFSFFTISLVVISVLFDPLVDKNYKSHVVSPPMLLSPARTPTHAIISPSGFHAFILRFLLIFTPPPSSVFFICPFLSGCHGDSSGNIGLW